MKPCVIFLRGRYENRHLAFYGKLCRGAFTVAADGGSRFFMKAGLRPNLLIGDHDSLARIEKLGWPIIYGGMQAGKTTVVEHPVDKDATDSQLALEYCVDSGAKDITIVQPSVGEADHWLSNLLLSFVVLKNKGVRVRVTDHKSVWYAIADDKLTLNGKSGDGLSIVPISPSIRLRLTGAAFPAHDMRVRQGDSIGCRNRFSSRRVIVAVQGKALVYHQFG